jgi:hypothetical protein
MPNRGALLLSLAEGGNSIMSISQSVMDMGQPLGLDDLGVEYLKRYPPLIMQYRFFLRKIKCARTTHIHTYTGNMLKDLMMNGTVPTCSNEHIPQLK